MAIIYSYPQKTTPAGNDFLVITDSEQPAPNKNRTKSLTIDNLANYVVTSTSGITGSGTLNTIAMFTPDGEKIGDSQLTQVGPSLSGLYQMRFDNADRFIINKPSSVTSGDPEYLIQQDGNYKVSFGWDDDGAGFGYIYNWAGNGLRLGAAGQNPQLELDTATPKIISYTDHEFQSNILGGNATLTNTLTVETIQAQGTGAVYLLGGVQIGDNPGDTLNIFSKTALFGEIKDSTFTTGTAGQVLVSNATGNVEWTDPAKLIPFQVTASPGTSSAYTADNSIVEISWTGGNGTYILVLPTATGSNTYRNIRFVTNGTFPGGASHKIEITALPGETVDGAAFFEISKTYEGVSLWSNGTEWIVIQAKAH